MTSHATDESELKSCQTLSRPLVLFSWIKQVLSMTHIMVSQYLSIKPTNP